jgi:uncharacterized small protein (DUF1192 family)
MPKAKHFKAAAFVHSKLFAGLTSFAQLETRIAALPDEKARGDAFEVFAEAYQSASVDGQSGIGPASIWPLAFLINLSSWVVMRPAFLASVGAEVTRLKLKRS